RREAERAGLVSSTYTHPIGFFGHAPGPTIGMWDNQDDTPGQGDWPLHEMTAYAIEGNVKFKVPEWDGQYVQIKLEQSALYDGKQVTYLAGRQTEWHVVRKRSRQRLAGKERALAGAEFDHDELRWEVADGVCDAVCRVDGDAVRVFDRGTQSVVIVGNDTAVAGGEIEGDDRIVELVNHQYAVTGAVDHDVDGFDIDVEFREHAAIAGRQVDNDDRVQAVVHDEGSLAGIVDVHAARRDKIRTAADTHPGNDAPVATGDVDGQQCVPGPPAAPSRSQRRALRRLARTGPARCRGWHPRVRYARRSPYRR